MTAWSFYPIVCGLGRAQFGLISVPAEDSMICVLDTVSKVGMETLLIYHLITDPDNTYTSEAVHEIVDALANVTIAAAHEVHL